MYSLDTIQILSLDTIIFSHIHRVHITLYQHFSLNHEEKIYLLSSKVAYIPFTISSIIFFILYWIFVGFLVPYWFAFGVFFLIVYFHIGIGSKSPSILIFLFGENPSCLYLHFWIIFPMVLWRTNNVFIGLSSSLEFISPISSSSWYSYSSSSNYKRLLSSKLFRGEYEFPCIGL